MRKQFETMQEGRQSDRHGWASGSSSSSASPPRRPRWPRPPRPPPWRPRRRRARPAGVVVTPMDLARPREPFALYGQRGRGQLLFDMGVAGDFVGNLTQRNVDKADAGTFAGQENRFFPREVELSFFGQIDPYARAEVAHRGRRGGGRRRDRA